jgi:hypothetical protein
LDWNEQKNLVNQKKHHVSLEAIHVFNDPFARSKQDRVLQGEERWQTIGTVRGMVVNLVAYTIRKENDEDIYRIISAKKGDIL